MSTMDDESPAKYYAGQVAKLSVKAYQDEDVSDALDACLQKAVEHFHILVDGTYLGKLKQMRGMLQMRLEASGTSRATHEHSFRRYGPSDPGQPGGQESSRRQ